MKVMHAIQWRQYARGLGWLLVALLGALLIDRYPLLSDGYTGRWLGACLKVATGAWGGYRISRDICRIDPSQADTGIERALMHLARALVIGAAIIGVCTSL